MQRSRLIAFAFFLLGLLWVLAQAGHAQTPAGDVAAPALTELERALVENVNLLTELRRAQLEADTCRGALAQPRADATAQQINRTLDSVKQRIEQGHPGFTWDATTGAFLPKPQKER